MRCARGAAPPPATIARIAVDLGFQSLFFIVINNNEKSAFLVVQSTVVGCAPLI
jgi:hypothetical protein